MSAVQVSQRTRRTVTNPCKHCGIGRSPKNPVGLCRDCWLVDQKRKTPERPVLKLKDLNSEQQICYDLIMAGRNWSIISSNEALLLVQNATRRGTLADELEFWQPTEIEMAFGASSLLAAINRR